MGPLQQEGVEGAGEIAPRAPTKTTSRSNSKVLSHGQESAIISVYEGLMDAGSDNEGGFPQLLPRRPPAVHSKSARLLI